MKERLAFISHEKCRLHYATYDHPESPERLEAIVSLIESGRVGGNLVMIEAPEAPIDVVAEVHPLTYLDRLKKACENGNYWFDYEDTFINRHSFEAAILAGGAVIEGVNLLLKGEFRRVFCAVRPPGHHAEREKGMGFCLLNNVAIAARYSQKRMGVEKIMIIDWDVHHGNGTQHIFEDDPTVFYVSLHEHPTFIFPGTGRRWETGTGKGRGFTLNIPLPPGAGDAEYTAALRNNVLPYLKAFKPDLIIISAGFDAHEKDPLGDMCVTEKGFYEMTRMIVEEAEVHSAGLILSVLEGGYHIEALVNSVEEHLRALMGERKEETCS